jgi:hypothetical protein
VSAATRLGEAGFRFCRTYPVQHSARDERIEEVSDFGLDRRIEPSAFQETLSFRRATRDPRW